MYYIYIKNNGVNINFEYDVVSQIKTLLSKNSRVDITISPTIENNSIELTDISFDILYKIVSNFNYEICEDNWRKVRKFFDEITFQIINFNDDKFKLYYQKGLSKIDEANMLELYIDSISSLKNKFNLKLRHYLEIDAKKIIPTVNKKILFVWIYNYIKFYSVHRVVNLSKKHMVVSEEIIDENLLNNIRSEYSEVLRRSSDIYDESSDIDPLNREDRENLRRVMLTKLFGCYIDLFNNPHMKFELNSLFDAQQQLQDFERNIIVVCYDNIKEIYPKFKKMFIKEETPFPLFDTVLTHEFGHLIFNNIGKGLDDPNSTIRRKFKETQANYFLSTINNGLYDKYIVVKTRYQPAIYKNPLLYRFCCHNIYNLTKSYPYCLYFGDYTRIL